MTHVPPRGHAALDKLRELNGSLWRPRSNDHPKKYSKNGSPTLPTCADLHICHRALKAAVSLGYQSSISRPRSDAFSISQLITQVLDVNQGGRSDAVGTFSRCTAWPQRNLNKSHKKHL